MTISLTKNSDGTWTDGGLVSIELPPRTSGEPVAPLSLPPGTSIVFIGPNGSGKTRMAGWLDVHNTHSFYLRARRNVIMPNSYTIAPEEEQYVGIYAGVHLGNTTKIEAARNFRYSPGRDSFGDDDFPLVMNVLGSRHATSALRFTASYDPTSPPKQKPESPLDAAIWIWSKVLPQLTIDASVAPELTVRRKGDTQSVGYKPQELSDGEKAIFYLVAKCMIAPRDSLIVVDEPEMYMHRSVRGVLWDAIEDARSDCVFSYFTHDLDFVRTRHYERVFGVVGHDIQAKTWDYAPFITSPDADERLQISIWGSRLPTLLVEGTNDSLDIKLASVAFPDFRILPSGSCDEIISSVAVLGAQPVLHHNKVYGLIDADMRPPNELHRLKKKGVYAIPFREIENVIVSSRVIGEFLKILGHQEIDVKAIMQKFSGPLRKRFESLRSERLLSLTKRAIMNRVEETLVGATSIASAADIIDQGAVDKVTAAQSAFVAAIFDADTWDRYLAIFSVRKDDFGNEVARALGMADYAAYTSAVLRMVRQDDDVGARIRAAMKGQFPTIPKDTSSVPAGS